MHILGKCFFSPLNRKHPCGFLPKLTLSSCFNEQQSSGFKHYSLLLAASQQHWEQPRVPILRLSSPLPSPPS